MTIRTLAEVKDLCPSCAAFHSIGDNLEDEDKNQRQRPASTRTAIAALLTNQTRPIDHVEAAQDLWQPLSGSGGEITREVHTGGLGGISTIKLRGRFPAIFVFKRPGRDASTLRRPREGQWSSACRVRRYLPPPAGDAGLSRTCRRPTTSPTTSKQPHILCCRRGYRPRKKKRKAQGGSTIVSAISPRVLRRHAAPKRAPKKPWTDTTAIAGPWTPAQQRRCGWIGLPSDCCSFEFCRSENFLFIFAKSTAPPPRPPRPP